MDGLAAFAGRSDNHIATETDADRVSSIRGTARVRSHVPQQGCDAGPAGACECRSRTNTLDPGCSSGSQRTRDPDCNTRELRHPVWVNRPLHARLIVNMVSQFSNLMISSMIINDFFIFIFI